MGTAIVTGGNRGIGLAISAGLVALGHEVWLGSRDLAVGRAAAERVGARPLQLDVGDSASIERAVTRAGAVDILINNAGVLGQGSVLDDELFEESLRVMVSGPRELMRLLTPGMIERGYGRVVNVSSGWGAFAEDLEGPGGYGVAKAALNALTLSAARSLPDTVKVNAMCPGWVRTRMGGAGATLTPEQGADTALWLATLDDDGPSGGFFRERLPIAW